jgi:hypothetical protein
MALNDPTQFKGITSLYRPNVSENLVYGTMEFLKWGFLQVGGFQNITRSPATSGSFGGNRFRLRGVNDPSYDSGRVWEGFRSDWVWESGTTYTGMSPIPVSGVWVNNSFYVPGHSGYGHRVDYPNGRIVFNSAIPTDSNVQASFSHRTVGVVKASEPYIQELMFKSFDISNSNEFFATASGTRNRLGSTRVQMPVIGVELVSSGKATPYELGGGQWVRNDLLFHIFTEDESERNHIRDALVNQNEKVFWLINKGLMKETSGYPFQLDSNGSPRPSAKMYPDLVAPTGNGGFAWRSAEIDNVRATDMEPVNNWLYRSTVRATFTVVMPDI